MAGMEGLGRVLNVIPIAADKPFALRDASAVTFVCTGNDTFTLKESSSFAGSPQALATIVRYYTSTATDGTATWVKHTQAAGSTVTQSSGTTVVEVLTSQLSDPFNYVRLTPSSGGLVTAIVHDLTVQRSPANLAKLGA